MKKMSIVLFIVMNIGLIGVALATDPMPAERPQFTVGDYWVYTKNPDIEDDDEDGSRDICREFVSQSDEGYTFSENGKLIYMDKHLVKEKIAGFPGPVLYFPITLGKFWHEEFTGKGGFARNARYTVEAYEQVTVPAGTFWAYRIEVQKNLFGITRGGGFQAPKGSITYWYSPEAKMVIKGGQRFLKDFKVQ